VGSDTVQREAAAADTELVGNRFRDESGFGMLELLIAMVVLNVGLFALVGAFNASTVTVRRASYVAAATAVADKQMEIYRSLQNCAIWLDPTSFPAANVTSAYKSDTTAYLGLTFFDKSASTATQGAAPWATSSTSTAVNTAWKADIPTSCTPVASVTPPTAATKATQTIAGPDGANYTVYTYIVITQPTSGTYVKQVTITVRDPTNAAKVLARQSTYFNPIAAP
jgi:type II secretory pathway pseudopilin PulG